MRKIMKICPRKKSNNNPPKQNARHSPFSLKKNTAL
jgi:hypothetical protein